jgi:hypothetical protein
MMVILMCLSLEGCTSIQGVKHYKNPNEGALEPL